MIRGKNRSVVLASLAVFTVIGVIGVMPAAYADDPMSQLLTLNPGVSRDDMLQAIRLEAANTGKTETQVLDDSLAGAQDSAVSANLRTTASSGGGGVVTLGYATYPGDVFVSPANTLFIQHGHTGIYFGTTVVVEAPGSGQVSRSINATSLSVGSGAEKMYVNVSYSDGQAAGDYAYNNLRGKPYNMNFAFNRDPNGSSMNCSQLVWAAYLQTLGIDLDYDGGPGVYPYDIEKSPWTVTYQTL